MYFSLCVRTCMACSLSYNCLCCLCPIICVSLPAQVINHGVPEKLMEETISVLKEFFQLPDDAKKDYYSEDFSSSDCILFTSCMNYGNEKVHQWRDFLKHSCHPVDKWQEFWPVNPVRYRYLTYLFKPHWCIKLINTIEQ